MESSEVLADGSVKVVLNNHGSYKLLRGLFMANESTIKNYEELFSGTKKKNWNVKTKSFSLDCALIPQKTTKKLSEDNCTLFVPKSALNTSLK